jgi:hypothetical protein
MGPEAPGMDDLIQSQLTGLDVTGVTDEFLDRIGWDRVAGRAVTLRRSKARKSAGPRKATPAPAIPAELRTLAWVTRRPAGPRRN